MLNRLIMVMGAGAVLAVGTFVFGELRSSQSAADGNVVFVPLAEAAPTGQSAMARLAGDRQQGLNHPTPTAGQVVYGCENGHAFGVQYGQSGGAAALIMNGGTSRLDPVFVAEGGEWSDGVLTLVTKGDFAEVFFAGQSTSGTCQLQR